MKKVLSISTIVSAFTICISATASTTLWKVLEEPEPEKANKYDHKATEIYAEYDADGVWKVGLNQQLSQNLVVGVMTNTDDWLALDITVSAQPQEGLTVGLTGEYGRFDVSAQDNKMIAADTYWILDAFLIKQVDDTASIWFGGKREEGEGNFSNSDYTQNSFYIGISKDLHESVIGMNIPITP
ncbi:MAG: hypothetical protein V7782_05035 [Psychromonas sp.]